MGSIETYEKIAAYIDSNPVATLGTVSKDGEPHGAVVYVFADATGKRVYFLTKSETQKYRNIAATKKVSLTIYNIINNSTLQAHGEAEVTHDSSILDMVMKKMVRANSLNSEWVPPVSKLQAGQCVLVGIALEHARLAEYQTDSRERIFTEV